MARDKYPLPSELIEDYEIATDTMQSLLIGRYDPIGILIGQPDDTVKDLSGAAKGLFEKIGNHQLIARSCLTSLAFPSKIYPKTEWRLHWELDSYAVLIRAAFECLLTIDHIFINPPSIDELLLRFKLWELGQTVSFHRAAAKLNPNALLLKNTSIKNIIDAIQNLPIYATLDTKSQAKINDMNVNKRAHWEYYVDNNILKLLDGWNGVTTRISSSLAGIHNLLSELAHPTSVSTYILVNNSPNRPKLHFQPDIVIPLGILVCSLAVRAAYLCFPGVAVKFKELPIKNQELINLHLKSWLGDGSEL